MHIESKETIVFHFEGKIRKTFESLNPNLITDNKKFWKQVKPFFSDKTPNNSKVTLRK